MGNCLGSKTGEGAAVSAHGATCGRRLGSADDAPHTEARVRRPPPAAKSMTSTTSGYSATRRPTSSSPQEVQARRDALARAAEARARQERERGRPHPHDGRVEIRVKARNTSDGYNDRSRQDEIVRGWQS
ncbi:hypothetical protein CDCA_CDCA03G0868 [Cyanidium caldarium]|uniref:Uncharacterized protein n=1 Tax=Cyanidium caldarium TaxID=2771 RepID=A0AAV9ISI0_CYACA|nr:hypothetical protein CDCA_CDCA03G0868 [Cyanidium caldarium]